MRRLATKPTFEHNELELHLRLLADRSRIEKFDAALREVIRPGDDIADVGAGSGILAAICSKYTSGSIWAIERSQQLSYLAEILLKGTGIHVLNADALVAELNTQPDVIVSETIGNFGPDEGIVELLYGLSLRCPSARVFIPATLTVFAQPVTFCDASSECDLLFSTIRSATQGYFCDQQIRSLQSFAYTMLHFGDLSSGAHATTSPQQLAQYELGKDWNSGFRKRLTINDGNCIHVYFEAALSDSIVLSTHFQAERTHWDHCFLIRPPDCTTVSIEYVPGASNPTVRWS